MYTLIYLYYFSRIIGAESRLYLQSTTICSLNPARDATGTLETLRQCIDGKVHFAKSYKIIGLGFLHAIAEARPQGCWH